MLFEHMHGLVNGRICIYHPSQKTNVSPYTV